MQTKFSKEDFEKLPDILINICDYANHVYHEKKTAPVNFI